MKKEEAYLRTMERCREADFSAPARRLLKAGAARDADKILTEISACVIGPVLTGYVLWVLRSAEKAGIRRLYFLSRDGFIMKRIADIFCVAYGLNLETRYLYCSRYALRLPLFYMNPDEALEKACSGAFLVTPEIILSRAGIPSSQIKPILSELGMEDGSRMLTKAEREEIRQRLSSCETFRTCARKVSEDAYRVTLAYFQQEGLLEPGGAAVVDTGWAGTLQRSIRQILEFSGSKAKPVGFYFGMFSAGKPEDGEFHCYSFDSNSGYFLKRNFNNVLFECFCSAPHGMTEGYSQEADGPIAAKLLPHRPGWDVGVQIDAVTEYARYFSEANQQFPAVGKDALGMSRRLFGRFTKHPSAEEADRYGDIPFCDDLTEKYRYCLADKLSPEDIRRQMIAVKLINRIRGRKQPYRASYWLEGTLKRYRYPHGRWIRFNIRAAGCLYDFFAFVKRRLQRNGESRR